MHWAQCLLPNNSGMLGMRSKYVAYESKDQGVVVSTCWELLSRWPSDTEILFVSSLRFEWFRLYTEYTVMFENSTRIPCAKKIFDLCFHTTCWPLALNELHLKHPQIHVWPPLTGFDVSSQGSDPNVPTESQLKTEEKIAEHLGVSAQKDAFALRENFTGQDCNININVIYIIYIHKST